MPAEAGLAPSIRDNSDGSICVQYEPKKGGRHEVQMSYDGNAVDGSPFQCVVDTIDGGFVTAYGAGLVGGSSGKQETFTVVAKRGTAASTGDIAVNIDGPSKVDVKRQDKPDGSSVFNYMPMSPGAYSISIKYKGKPIKDSPFNAKISGEGRKRSQLSLGNSSEYNLGVMEADIVNLTASIITPSKQMEPCLLKKMPNGQLGIAPFQPKEKGTYSVGVYRDEKNIQNSPFKVNVTDKEIGHGARVKVTGATQEASANEHNEVVVDTNGAGYGGLSVALEGPHRSEVDCIEIKDNKVYKINYSPHEPGIYILNIRYADEHVPGSPFLVNVGGNPSGRQRNTKSKELGAAEPVNPGSTSEFILHIPGTNPFDMEASVTDPTGTTELCEVQDKDDFHYLVKFTPTEVGTHTLSVKHKGLHVSGSPFQYTVGQLSSGGSHKVQAGGPGLERGEVGAKNAFNINSREAGPGELTIAVEGPGKSIITMEDRPNGFLGCTFNADKPGSYGVHIKFDDEHIPNSPFIVNVATDSGVAKKVTVHGIKDKGLAIDKPLTFTVNYNGATGVLHTASRSPSGGHEDCFVQEMDTGLYAIRFIPRENGVHYIDVKLNDGHIPDSPIAVLVGSMAADPAMVNATGEGLEKGRCAQKSKFLVRTAGAGPGLLAVFIDGPSKVSLSCKEQDDGYEFLYTPFAPGKYLITVKYGNIPIAGSPYAAIVSGTGRKPSPISEQSCMVVETVEKKPGAGSTKKFRGDASKVVAKGPGLKKAMTNRNVQLTLDVKDAGHALLNVGMMSPAGLPEPELTVKKTSNTLYTIVYKVQEIGEHVLQIRWGDEDIPGSPFNLHT